MSSDYWTDNKIEKPQQIVVCAAIKIGDLIIAGARHHDKVMKSQLSYIDNWKQFKHNNGEVQGFIDQFGDFLTREEAMQIVKDNGQRFNIDHNGSDTVLFSEGLY